MNNRKISLLAVLSLVVGVTYCDSNYFGRILTRNTPNTPDNVKVTPIDVPPGGDTTKEYSSVIDSWKQDNTSTYTSADIVFAFDRSGSMTDNIDAVKNSLKGWLETLDSLGLPNYCVGVLSSVTGANGGVMQEDSHGHKCLCRRDANGDVLMTPTEISDNFAYAVDHSAVAGTGTNGEAGIYSVTKAITTKLTDNQSTGECFSNDKALVVFMASDENDDALAGKGSTVNYCTGNVILSDNSVINLGTTPIEFDNSFSLYGDTGYQITNTAANNFTGGDETNICSEIKQRLKYYVDPTPVSGKYVNVISPNTLFDAIIAYNDTLPSYGNVITYPTGTNSAFSAGSAAEGPGHGYLEFADLMGQAPINIDDAVPTNQTAFNAKMDDIAHDLVTQLSFLRTFNLSDPVCSTELDSLVVKVNNTTVAASKYTLNTAHNKVTFVPTFSFHQNDVVDIAFTKCI